MFNQLLAILIFLTISISSFVSANVTINIEFGEGFDGVDSVDQQRVVLAAADYWEAMILTDFTVDILVKQVDLSPIGAGVLGRMHSNVEMKLPSPVTQTRLPMAGTIELAINRIDEFYFDPTPYDSTEFDLDVRGNGPALSGSNAQFRFDALSVWIHEIGHVLGYSGASGTYVDGNPFSAFTDYTNNFNGPFEYEFDWLTNGTEGNAGDLVAMFNFFHIASEGPGSWIASLNPFFSSGMRRLVSPIDVDIVADSFHLQVDDLALPLLGDVNCDGNLDLLDVAPFVDRLVAGEYQGKADINGDGAVDLLDVEPFVDLLTAG